MASMLEAYLAKADPDAFWAIKILTGGVVNIVARATSISGNEKSVFRGHQSLILKYAPPYVAGVGEHAPLSQFRQTIEARALSLLTSMVLGAHNVSLPYVLRHDVENNILIISDLGQLPNLSEVFSNVGGFTPMIEVPPVTPMPPAQFLSDQEMSHYMVIGSKIGSFFAELHTPRLVDKLLKDSTLGPSYLSTSFMRNGVLEYAIKPVRAHLDKFPDLIQSSEADELYQRIEDNFTRPNQPEELSMVLGDCWTGAILIDPDSSNPDPKVGVIDWEFANIHRGFHGDIAQLLAHFETFRIAAELQGLGYYVAALDVIVGSFVTTYKSESLDRDAMWTVQRDTESPLSDPIGATMRRSALIGHAAELINVAFWKVWRCTDPTCPRSEDGSHTSVQHECTMIKKVVETAIWYLRHSGKDTVEFYSGTNWAELTRDDEIKSGKALLDLL